MPLSKIFKDVPLDPQSPPEDTIVYGIKQTDFLVRTAILAGLKDIRNHPVLIDYIFSDFLYDPTTNPEERKKLVQAAKNWILSVKIPVIMYPKLDQMEFPCITVAMQESSETENSLGDVHYTPAVDNNAPNAFSIGPFAPVSYDSTTGEIILPTSLYPLYTTPQMVVLDKNGTSFPILKNGNGKNAFIALNVQNSALRSISILPRAPNSRTSVESVFFNESYSIGCHTEGEPMYTVALHSLVLFILLRYRETLLESRGFERTTIKNGPLIPNDNYVEGKENIFTRYITVSGSVKHVWPKYTYPTIATVVTDIVVDGSNTTPSTMIPTGDTFNDLNWHGDKDFLTSK
jgi:hypothetical protein